MAVDCKELRVIAFEYDIEECLLTLRKKTENAYQFLISKQSATPNSISIIGGGISGLSAAYHASRTFPNTPVNVFEASDRLGGWINSERINLGSHGSALLESGPRTLRPNGVSGALVLDLVRSMNTQGCTHI